MRIFRRSLTLAVVVALAGGLVAGSAASAQADDPALTLGTHTATSEAGRSQTFVVLYQIDGAATDVSDEVTLTSSVATDIIAGTKITYRDAGVHSLTFSLDDSDSTRSVDISVAPPRLVLGGLTGTIQIGTSVTMQVSRSDRVPVDAPVVVTSTGRYDTIVGTTVTFGSVGARTLTVTSAGLTRSVTIRVAAPSRFVIPATTVTGETVVRSTITATTATWSPFPSAVSYAWMRNGVPIPGAAGKQYRLSLSDVGTKLSVQVTAVLPGYETAISQSRRTAKVQDVAKLRLTVPKKLVAGAAGVKKNVISVTLKPGPSKVHARGTVKIHVGSHVLTAKLGKKAVVHVTLPKLKKGSYRIFATYLGTASYAAATTTVIKRSAK